MKTSTILILLFAFLFIQCKSTSSNDIAGSYTNQSKSEYSMASDTLTITLVNQTENTYQVQRKTGYQRIRVKVTQPKQYKEEKWQATWNPDKQILAETEFGRQISLDKDKHTLILKNAAYQRIK